MRLDSLERLAQGLKRSSGVTVVQPMVTTHQRLHSERLMAAARSAAASTARMSDGGAGKLPFVWGRNGLTQVEIEGDRWIML